MKQERIDELLKSHPIYGLDMGGNAMADAKLNAARVQLLAKALIRLRDCDFVISLPDRMDAVRVIARDALKEAGLEG